VVELDAEGEGQQLRQIEFAVVMESHIAARAALGVLAIPPASLAEEVAVSFGPVSPNLTEARLVVKKREVGLGQFCFVPRIHDLLVARESDRIQCGEIRRARAYHEILVLT
jgi:hypothetical protein